MPEKTEKIEVRCSPELKAKAQTAAEEKGVSVSEWIRVEIRTGFVQQQIDKATETDA